MHVRLQQRTIVFYIYLLSWFSSLAGPDPIIRFIENRNQWPSAVQFSASVPGGKMFISPGTFTYQLVDESAIERNHLHSHDVHNESDGNPVMEQWIKGHVVDVFFEGANSASVPQPFGKLSTYYNYFLGNDPSRWASKAYAYEGMLYPSFYEGIDLKVYSSGSHVKYDFLVLPGADPSRIELTYDGQEDIFLENGDLHIKTTVGDIIEKRPIAYQFIAGKRQQVSCEYALNDNALSYIFPSGYDTCHLLVIDPLLIFSTYSGSTADNWGSTATPGENGTLYSAGVTTHERGGVFPATAGAFQTSYGGIYDIGILKFDSLGKELIYASYLGGEATDFPHSLIVNDDRELIVLGTTASTDFPTSAAAYDKDFNGGDRIDISGGVSYTSGSDIAVTRLNSDGSQLLASTYLGGSSNDGFNPSGVLARNYGDELRGDIVADGDGNIYISSVTTSDDFPVINSFGSTYNGGTSDALLIKLDAELSDIIWSAFLGGSGADASYSLKLDSVGNVFCAGGTNSNNFPTTAGSYQPGRTGDIDGWIAQVSGDGSSVLKATYTGSSSYDQVYFLDLNDNQEVYVYGQTRGGAVMVSTAMEAYRPNSGQFVQKFTNDLSARIFSTVFGSGSGYPDISPTAFLVNECDNLFMAGWGGRTNSGFWPVGGMSGMPVSDDAFQKSSSGSDFYFIVLAKDASEFLYGTFFGGNQSYTHVDGGTSRFDKSGVVYHAVCAGCWNQTTGRPNSDFPTTSNVWSRSNNSQNCNNAAFKFDLASLKSSFSTDNLKVCIPGATTFKNNSIGGQSFEWDFGDGTIIETTDTMVITHEWKTPGIYQVRLKVTDLGTCKVVDQSTVPITVFNRQSVVQDDDAMCEKSSYTLRAGSGVSYQWISGDSSFTSAFGSPVISPRTSTTYYVKITEATGCTVYDTVQIRVVPSFDVKFDYSKTTLCLARPVLHVIDSTKGAADAQMIFDFGDGATSDLAETSHEYAADGTYQVKLTGIREFCTYESQAEIPIYSVTIPNVITPAITEGDNDALIVRMGPPEEQKSPSDFGLRASLIIYNRWGKKLYEDNDYQNNWSGEGLSSGVYYYELTVEGYAPCRSWVHVIK